MLVAANFGRRTKLILPRPMVFKAAYDKHALDISISCTLNTV